MHDVTYRTLVYWVPPSPLGLVGNRWAIEHRCHLCRAAVATDQLLDHAQDHGRGTIVTAAPDNRGAC